MTRLLLIASLIFFTNCGDSDDDATTTDDLSVPEFSVKPLKGTAIDVSSDLLAASDGVSCADQEDFYETHGAIAATDFTNFHDADNNNPEVFVTSIYAAAMHFDCMVRAMFDDATPDSTGDVVEYSDETGDNDYFVAWNKDASTNVTDGRLVVKVVGQSGDDEVTTEVVITLSHDASKDTKTLKGILSKQVGDNDKTWSGAYIHAFEDNTGDMNHYVGLRVFGTKISLVGAHMIKEKGASMFTQQCPKDTDDKENTACSMINSTDDSADATLKVVYFDKAGESVAEAGTGLFALAAPDGGEALFKWLDDHVDIDPLYGTADGLFEDAEADLFEADYSKP